MSRYLKLIGIALLALFIIVPVASAQRGGGFRGRGGFGGRGGFYGRGYYGGGWGVGWYGPGWGWGWYDPYGWGYPYGYQYGPSSRHGDVKIEHAPKDAMVYVDGGYAGTVGELKKFPLTVGNHNIELRDPSGHTYQKETIDIVPGKTIEINGGARGH